MPPLHTQLPIEGPYHLGQTLTVLSMGRGNPCLRHNDRQGQLTLGTPDGPVAIAATHAGDRLEVHTDGPGAAWVQPHLPAVFGLLDQPSGLELDGNLRRLAAGYAGLRLPCLPTVFARLVQIVLQQLISFRDACRGWRLLVLRHGEEVPGSQGLYFPPTAERIARLATYQLMECEILPRQAKTIQRLATQADQIERLWNAGGEPGVVDPAAADSLSGWLAEQPGVGPWTVGCLRGAGLGDPDAEVLGDYGHPHHVTHYFTGRERGDDEEMLRLLEPYRPHRFRVLTLLILGAKPPPRHGPRRARLRERFQ